MVGGGRLYKKVTARTLELGGYGRITLHRYMSSICSWIRESEQQQMSQSHEAQQSTCRVLASVLILSEMSAAPPSPPLPLALPLSGLRRASRPRGPCTRVLSYESDSLDVSIVWDAAGLRW